MGTIYKIAIVGGGYSGMVAACRLAEFYGGEVALIEKNDRLGKKILATGNGRGNVTNADLSAMHYHSVCGANVLPVITAHGNKSVEDWFYSIGVPISYETKKAFPSSKQASSLSDAMRAKLAYENATVITSFEVVNIVKNGGVFSITAADGREIKAYKLILACGGKAGKQYGTDGGGFNLAVSLGHTVTPIYPSLVQIKTEREKIKGLKGIKAESYIVAIVGGKEVANACGDVLFTEYGISGNAVFYVSAYLAGAKNAKVKISFLPEYDEERLYEIIRDKILNMPYLTIDDLLCGVVNKQIGKAVIRNLGITDVDIRHAKSIAKEIKGMELKVEGTLGFDYAQVTRGGVRCDEIDEITFESKKTRDLYLVGEILDVDGDCGGYNLQFAYSSATAAAENIITHGLQK